MALTIRMQRCGSNKNPHYRLVVTERASRRDGKYVELLGNYAPRETNATRRLTLDVIRVDHWLKIGAKPSDTARTLIAKARKAPKAEVAAVTSKPAEAKVEPKA